MRSMKVRLTVALAGFSGLWLAIVLAARWDRPENLSGPGIRLADCPESPNCVCSREPRESHRIDPLPLGNGDPDSAMQQITELAAGLPGAETVRLESDYAWVEFRSRWIGYVDDVEFELDREAAVIHVRSASRTGYSDLGVNRERVDRIRLLWDDHATSASGASGP